MNVSNVLLLLSLLCAVFAKQYRLCPSHLRIYQTDNDGLGGSNLEVYLTIQVNSEQKTRFFLVAIVSEEQPIKDMWFKPEDCFYLPYGTASVNIKTSGYEEDVSYDDPIPTIESVYSLHGTGMFEHTSGSFETIRYGVFFDLSETFEDDDSVSSNKVIKLISSVAQSRRSVSSNEADEAVKYTLATLHISNPVWTGGHFEVKDDLAAFLRIADIVLTAASSINSVIGVLKTMTQKAIMKIIKTGVDKLSEYISTTGWSNTMEKFGNDLAATSTTAITGFNSGSYPSSATIRRFSFFTYANSALDRRFNGLVGVYKIAEKIDSTYYLREMTYSFDQSLFESCWDAPSIPSNVVISLSYLKMITYMDNDYNGCVDNLTTKTAAELDACRRKICGMIEMFITDGSSTGYITNRLSNSAVDSLILNYIEDSFPISWKYRSIRMDPVDNYYLGIYDFVGCFEDGGDRDLPIFKGHKKSPANCAAECGRDGYPFAGLQVSRECWCGKGFGKYNLKPTEECIDKCEDGESCGSPWRNSVYYTGISMRFDLAKYPDRSLDIFNSRIWNNQNPLWSWPSNSWYGQKFVFQARDGYVAIVVDANRAMCVDVAYSTDVHIHACHYFGNQLWRIVPSSGTESIRFISKSDGTAINLENGNSAIGANINMAVANVSNDYSQMFAITSLNPVDSEFPDYVGCFEDGPSRDLPIFKGVQPSPALCAAFCGLDGYPFAGLQVGNECWCGNGFGKYQQKRKECSFTCSNGGSCGGPWRNSVYYTGIVMTFDVAMFSDRSMDVYSARIWDNQTPLWSYSFNGLYAQRFVFEARDGFVAILVDANRRKCVDVSNTINVVIHDCTYLDNQLWRIVPSSNYLKIRFINKQFGTAIDLNNGDYSQGAKIGMVSNVDSNNQQFKIRHL